MSKNFFSIPGFVILTLFLVFSVGNVIGQSQTGSSLYIDRWDPGRTEREMWGTDMMGPVHQSRMERHWTFMNSGIPLKYRGQRNPLSQTVENVQSGGERYQKQCSGCHGPQGLGNGVIANSLNPSPTLLAYMIQIPMAVDEYLMWCISEGGAEFGSTMPAFKDKLSDKEIWEIVTYMRAGFPANSQGN